MFASGHLAVVVERSFVVRWSIILSGQLVLVVDDHLGQVLQLMHV